MDNYVSLHNHTSMSIMDSVISKPIDLFQRAKELGQSAIAITEHGSLVSLWDSLKASKKTGVKLIAGCEMYFVDDVSNDQDNRLRHIILIAKNQIGYKNLLCLNKKGYDNYIVAFKKAVPRIDWKLLEEYKEGLICTTACGNGIISQLIMMDKLDAAREQANKLKDIFGDDLALELQPHNLQRKANSYSGQVDQRKINLALKKLGEELNIRCIVASDTHYLAKEHHKANEVLLAIGSGQPVNSGQRLSYDKPDMYLKSASETLQYFERHRPMWGDEFIESLFANTVYLASKCEEPDWIDPKFTNPSGKELPQFPVKDQPDYQEFLVWNKTKNTGLDEDVMYLRYLCERELDRRFKSGELTSGSFDDYQARVLEELDVLEFHGFSSYMLIVADYLDWASKNGIAVGPGRGSCGGCFVAYLLNIHKADPLKYQLIFARFHNKEKSNFPDIDSDVAPSGREKVQEYIRQKYGDEFVAHVSNVNTITPKVYARDISRAFEFGDEGRSGAAKIGDAIADSIPVEMKTATQALNDAPLFAEYSKQYPQLKDYAELIGGKARAWSTHAAGIVVNKRKLTGVMPLRRDIYGQLCIEFEKEKADENGLIKQDLLGLETLDIISDTYRLIKERGKIHSELFDYNAYDEKAYQLISDGNTFCVFQLGSTAAHLCKAIKPRCIEDISLINALVRPAAKSIVNDLINVRDGKAPMRLFHPLLERAFAGTYGFGLFEESLMYLAQDVAGWDLHEADKLRKLTKEKGKNPEKVAGWRKEFIEDAQKNKGLDEETATKIWDEIIAVWSGYGFNSCLYFSELVDTYTSDGKIISSKLICEIKSGEFVRSRDEKTQKDIFVEVICNHNNNELDVVEVELDTGEKVRCTMNHKFRVRETGDMLSLRDILANDFSIVVGKLC